MFETYIAALVVLVWVFRMDFYQRIFLPKMGSLNFVLLILLWIQIHSGVATFSVSLSHVLSVLILNISIQDVHGNYLVGPTSTNDILYETSYYNDGLFLSKTQKKFYDIHMNVKIDLSEYDILFWEGNTGTPGWQEEYAFKDGYCGIEVQNENRTRFYGVLDTNGKWIIELTDTLASNSDGYSGKVTETKIKMGQRLYDIESHEFMSIPTDVSDNRKLIKGKYYFVNDKNEFWWYNPDTGEIKPLSLTVG